MARRTEDDENMTSVASQIAAAVAGLALLATCFVIFPRDGVKGVAKGIGIAVSLAVLAAILITAARAFGP
jgi:hypothetical protein